MRAGASLSVADHHGSTALHRAAHGGNVRVVEALCAAGAPLEAADRMGQTPLHVAASNGCFAAVRCLVRRGASPKARDGPLPGASGGGRLPEEVAEMWGETDIAAYLSKGRVEGFQDTRRSSLSTTMSSPRSLSPGSDARSGSPQLSPGSEGGGSPRL